MITKITNGKLIATADAEYARRLGEICGVEGSAVGANWAFAPIVDIDTNWRNPITNVRTFGSDPEKVKAMGVAYVEEIQKHGVARHLCGGLFAKQTFVVGVPYE